MRKVLTLLAFALLSVPIHAQELVTIGVIDFYGLRSLTEDEIRAVLPFSVCDLIALEPVPPELESELAEALNIARVGLTISCCTEPNTAILYVGVEEAHASGPQYRPEPTGDAVLPPEIQGTDREIISAFKSLVMRQDGNLGEDWSMGHSLMKDPEIRALQERYIDYAEKYRERLIEVLHGSAEQRALAATVLSYASDKKAIVPHLEAAVLDPDEGVRNDATRALALIASYAKDHPELGIELRADLFVDMLNSIEWKDRNKAAAVLSSLTESRDPTLMQQIRVTALPSLIDMCRWKNDGHTFFACRILERAVGLPEQEELHPKDETIAMALDLMQR